jgi:hypothetical protein
MSTRGATKTDNSQILYKQNKFGQIIDSNYKEVKPKTQGFEDFKTYLSNNGTVGTTTFVTTDCQAQKDEYRRDVDEVVEFFDDNALSYAINKFNKSEKMLKSLRETYENKYRVAKKELTSGIIYQTVIDTLQKEMKDELTEPVLEALLTAFGVTPTGDHLNKMFQLVVFKYEYGQSIYFNMKALAEHFRTKIDMYIKSGDWGRVDMLFNFMFGIMTNLDPSKLEEYKKDLDEIDLSFKKSL